jgi:hypothetical protein
MRFPRKIIKRNDRLKKEMGGNTVVSKKSQYVWVHQAQSPKFTANEKAGIVEKVKGLIRQLPKVSKKVSRVEMRANRVYLYELVEQFRPEGAIFTKPLINDKYLEYPYARITLQDTQGENCTVDWQRHNNQWVTLPYSGTITECIDAIEHDDCWF